MRSTCHTIVFGMARHYVEHVRNDRQICQWVLWPVDLAALEFAMLKGKWVSCNQLGIRLARGDSSMGFLQGGFRRDVAGESLQVIDVQECVA